MSTVSFTLDDGVHTQFEKTEVRDILSRDRDKLMAVYGTCRCGAQRMIGKSGHDTGWRRKNRVTKDWDDAPTCPYTALSGPLTGETPQT